MGLTKAQRAARKAWETRRRLHPEKYGKKRGAVVGFYKDKKKRTRPITKSATELKRKKVLKKPKKFKGVEPKKWAKDVPLKKGSLKQLGYDPWSSARKRHEALNKSIKKAGLETTRRRVQFLANVTSDRKKLDKVYKEDLAWLKAKKKPKSKAEQLRTIMEREKPSKRGTGLKTGTARKKRGQGKPLTEPQRLKRHPEKMKLKQTRDVKVYRQPALRTWRYQSKSSPGKYYTVRLNEDETLSCNCPGWIFSKKPKSCRHTREVHTKHKVG